MKTRIVRSSGNVFRDLGAGVRVRLTLGRPRRKRVA
jgi:hypothetical protein